MLLSRRLLLGFAGAALTAQAARAAAAAICGAALPLTGVAALAGDEVLRGIMLAADAVNAAGGVAGTQLQLLTTDMPDPASVTQAVNGLLNRGHASLVLGSGSSALSYPASAAAELAQIPFIELTASADGICSRGFKYLLRTGPSTQMGAQLAVQTLQARFAGRTLGVLYNTGASGTAFAAAMGAALDAAKLPVALSIGYPEYVEDLHDEVGRLKRAKVDVLLHAAEADDALGLALAASANGWKPGALIGYGAGYSYRETPAVVSGAISGTYVIAAPFYSQATAGIRDAYLARYGNPPRSADSLTAYVGAKLVFDTLNAVNGDASKLLAGLRRADLPKGSLANGFGVKFDRNGQNTGSYLALQQWRGAELEPV